MKVKISANLFLFCIQFSLNCEGSISDEYRLLQDLFERREGGYNPKIRPVKNMSDTIYVGFEMALIQLINLDERNQIMKSNVWLRLHWCDYQMIWSSDEYGGIDIVRIQYDRLWNPNIVLFNNADGRFEVSFASNILVSSNGWIMWIPCTIYKSSCSIDVTYFPFDEQECELSFASWTYNSNEVTIRNYLIVGDDIYSDVDLSDYEKSGSWDLIAIPGEIKEKDNKTFLTYKIKMRRKTLFYTVNLIIPCFLISFLSVFVFLLPADSGEKTVMSVSILLALVVFLQVLITNLLPPSSTSIPLFAKYLLVAVILDVCAVVNTIFVLNWHFKTPRTHRMPRWVRLVFIDFLPKILFLQKNNDQSQLQHFQTNPNESSFRPPQNFSSPNPNFSDQPKKSAIKPLKFDFSDIHSQDCPLKKKMKTMKKVKKHNVSDNFEKEKNQEMMTFKPEVNKAIEAVRFISAHLKNEDDYEEVVNDWHYIAHVIDRLLMYIYLFVSVTATIAILACANVWETVDQDAFKARFKKRHDILIHKTVNTLSLCPWDEKN